MFTGVKKDNNLIPAWLPSGRRVLLPNTDNLSDEKNFRPITCLNTSYKILTGLIAKYMTEHARSNTIWDEVQLGAVEGVLGMIDQLIIDRCIMEEVKQYHRNLAVAFYDYKKAYNKVHHDWMLRVYQWIGIPREVVQLISVLMEKWKTRLEIWNNGEKMISRWQSILCVDFYKETVIHQLVFAFLRYQCASCYSRVKDIGCKLLQQSKGYKMLAETKLNDASLIHAINEKVVPVAAYPMNVCQFYKGDLIKLDQVVKRELRSRNMLGRQGSDERLYLKR